MLRTSSAITLFTLSGSGIGFINQILIAHYFGASAAVDAYLIAIGLPTLVVGIAVSLFNYSMVPALTLQRGNSDGYFGFLKVALLLSVGLALALAVAGLAVAPQYVGALGKQIPHSARETAIVMNRIVWGNSGLMILLAYLTAVSNAEKRFLLPAATTVLPPACAAMFVLGASHVGIEVVPIGMGFGTFLALVLLVYAVRDLIRPRAKSPISREDVRRVLRFLARAPLVLVAMACFSAYAVIDVVLTSRLTVGDLSYLGYAQRLVIATGNFIIVGPFTILGPYLAESWTNDQKAKYFSELGHALRLTVTLSAPVVLFISVFVEPVTALLFERGSFDYTATKGVAQVLPAMLIGMIAMLGVAILFRALFARDDYRWAATLGGGWVLLYFALGALLSERAGVRGIGIAYTLSWWLVFGVGLYATYGWLELRSKLRAGIVFLIRILIALAAVGFVITVVRDHWLLSESGQGSGSRILFIAVIFVVAMVTYWVLVRLLLNGDRKSRNVSRALSESRPLRK